MASASSLAHFNAGQSSEGGFETIEIDPQYAQGLGLAQGDLVRSYVFVITDVPDPFGRLKLGYYMTSRMPNLWVQSP